MRNRLRNIRPGFSPSSWSSIQAACYLDFPVCLFFLIGRHRRTGISVARVQLPIFVLMSRSSSDRESASSTSADDVGSFSTLLLEELNKCYVDSRDCFGRQ